MEFWFYVIWATLAAVTLIVGCIWIYSKIDEKKRITTAKEPMPPVVHIIKEPVRMSEQINDVTEDSRYAKRHNMWTCAYCETLNACPPGMTVGKKAVPTEPRPASGLTGHLARKAAYAAACAVPKKLVCIACGKSQEVDS